MSLFSKPLTRTSYSWYDLNGKKKKLLPLSSFVFSPRHSFDAVSAESAISLFTKGDDWGVEEEEKGVAIGLTDRREYNGFVPLMDEGDPLKTAVITIFSGLQVSC